ncbi:GNAT family N-acetyltransferase [Streptomyces acidiscabies]|uniref:N-acetyltransferase n=1 Tax=Streptomyces acidiscabies TaxID=42234 RepID=A0AAP6BFD8_9ACTN|nr:GNAT family N-acetyltransferase [Streptomyces acidiscabies]MBP5936794.1 N-acetyltransferase [Streptomyces sp. LBUM 1476]MBZ3915203.1 N-acetyltransferase [Streptomyces acidiscabies]MDX2963706.1 N-acetyltransferase [Streptomyces acidiscabies]MDX3021265.1 N-acetyltransferase [Streptomyces acidiscabies]MDX3793482.1 N-acetyltransferase [Streptomyces acidiscabies]
METLRDILDGVAHGVFPPPDGRTTVVPQMSRRDAGVLNFTAHAVVFLDEDPEWVYAQLRRTRCDPYSAPTHPAFLHALLDHTGRTAETIDTMLVAQPRKGELPFPLREITDTGHPRVTYALERRDDVRAWQADGGVLVLGRGIGGRLEVSVEVDDAVRGRGLGRQLVTAARHSASEPVWAQIAPGNARSVRAFQAAGYVPVGSELLMLSTP